MSEEEGGENNLRQKTREMNIKQFEYFLEIYVLSAVMYEGTVMFSCIVLQYTLTMYVY